MGREVWIEGQVYALTNIPPSVKAEFIFTQKHSAALLVLCRQTSI